jgi:DNA-binding response OmpR family regulator
MSEDILLVDDDDVICEELRSILMGEMYTVQVVSDGQAAGEALRKQRFGLVLLDLKIPGFGSGLGGLTLLKRIKSSWPRTRVLVVSGRPISARLPDRDIFAVSEQDKQDEQDLKLADGFLSKPFNVDEFLLQVRQLLSDAPDRGGL